MRPAWLGLGSFPIRPSYSGLSENAREEVAADVATMGVGNRQQELLPPHEFMTTPGVGAGEAEASKRGNEIPPRNRTERGHVTLRGARAR